MRSENQGSGSVVASRSELSRRKIVSHLLRLQSAQAFEPVVVAPAVHPSPSPRRKRATGQGEVVGERRAKRTESHYTDGAPWAARAHAAGKAAELGRGLLEAHELVRTGGSLLDAVNTGTRAGWELRMALSNVAGEPLANWDRSKSKGQRLELLQRALVELGVWSTRKGGWRVAR